MSELMSSSLTDTKTAECLSAGIGQICCLLSNKIVVANALCGDCFILTCFSWLSHVNCNLFMLCSVRAGSRQAVPNKLIWFSDAVLLFVVEWRQNLNFSSTKRKVNTCSDKMVSENFSGMAEW